MPGVLFSSGVTWTEFRRTSLNILKDFGFGKESFENIVEEEVDNLINHIDQNFLNQPVDVSRLFNIAVLASLWRIISGECLKIGDPKLEYTSTFIFARKSIVLLFDIEYLHSISTLLSLLSVLFY